MADKNIGALAAAADLYDDSLLVAEQQGAAVKVTGRQFKSFAQAAVRQYVDDAQNAANDALGRGQPELSGHRRGRQRERRPGGSKGRYRRYRPPGCAGRAGRKG